ncbi:MAG: hypothetical protein HYY86_01845 [Candidatus Harrisonbacteria bacterium]|nr:hypothetical protein [Candidatus Harrisonbacteria bacterium]
MEEKICKVTEAEFLAHVLPDEKQKSAEPTAVLEPDDPQKPRVDSLAPDGDKTICAVHLANEILEQTMALEPDSALLKELFNKYEEINLVCNQLLRGAPNNHPSYQDFLDARAKIAQLRKEFQQYEARQKEMLETQKILLSIRDKILAGDTAELKFIPKFRFRINTRKGDIHYGEIAEWKGKKVRNGSFVTVTLSEEMNFFKLPFALGLKDLDEPLIACEAHIEELQNIRLLTKTVPHRYKKDWKIIKLDLLYAQTYEDAKERMRGLKNWLAEQEAERVRYKYADEHPEIIDLEREKKIRDIENTSFGMAFLGIFAKSVEELVKILKSKSKEELAALQVIMVENRGDDGERDYFGHAAKKGGKPAGLGWPGGATESDKYGQVLDQDIKRILPPELAKQTLEDGFLYKIIGHSIREYQNESGHEVLKIFERPFRKQKGENHVDHFWTKIAHKEKNLPVKESHEIVRTVYPTVGELFRMWLKGGDPAYLGPPYYWHLMALIALFQKYDIPLIDEMEEFLKSKR